MSRDPERADLLLVAGEASGDLHGARLLAELRRRRPQLRAYGLGSSRLRAAGLESFADAAEISAVGLVEVLKVVPRARAVFQRLLEETARRRPRLAVLIDFPEFNLRLARRLHRLGVPVVYYVSPQVWAWRRGRVSQIGRDVDRMLVLFPFEAEFYRNHDIEVEHVGHPLVDEVPNLPHVWDSAAPPGRFGVILLPGSRRSEVKRLLPVMLESVARLSRALPVEARLLLAPTIDPAEIEPAMREAGIQVAIVPGDERRFAALAASHLALCASGTATLETGLAGTPMLVLYRLGLGTYWMGRLLVRLQHVSLVNLVLGREAVPELLQDAAEPAHVAATARRLLESPEAIARMRAALAELRGRLGAPGATARAADAILQMLERAA